MKALKFIFKFILWLVAILLVLILLLPLWIGPVVTGVANQVVPGIVGTEFRMGEFGLNPYTGCLHVGDIQLANPTNFNPENCVELGDLDVNVAMTSLTGKKIIIEEIALDGLLVSSTATGDNFKQIAANAAGTEQPQATDSQTASTTAPTTTATTEPAQSADAQQGVQIDRIVLSNVKVKYGMPFAIPIPTIVIRDLGKESETGVTIQEVAQRLTNAVMASVGAVGDLSTALGTGTLNLGTDTTKQVEESAKQALQQAEKTVDAFKDLFKKRK